MNNILEKQVFTIRDMCIQAKLGLSSKFGVFWEFFNKYEAAGELACWQMTLSRKL